MSSSPQPNPDNQEIDLSQISKKLGKALEDFFTWIFRGFLFIKRNLIILAILFIIGAGLGYYLDKKTKIYDHELIVFPNFGSTDYMYSKINLLQSKIIERDTAFLKQIGIKDAKKFTDITVEPIVDVYKFIENKPENFELIKLMAEDGDINKIIGDPVTSKNYPYHLISYTTKDTTSREKTAEPLLKYLNDSDYYQDMQKVQITNTNIKIASNDSILSQIDGILNEFSKSSADSGVKNDKLVYYNENTQLNEIIKTKDALIQEKGYLRMNLINLDKIIKENSSVLNIKNRKAVNGKMKFVIPILFIGIFIFFGFIRAYYRHQMGKQTKI